MTAYMGEPNATLLQNIAIFENAGAPISLKFAVLRFLSGVDYEWNGVECSGCGCDAIL